MSVAQRRPALMKLTLPHPPLSCLQPSPSNEPKTNPITPINTRRDTFRPRASVDSWCSTDSGCSGMSCEYDWTQTQIAILHSTLENIPSHLFTPFVGSVPPQNVLQRLARSIKEGKDISEWPHSVKATRLMLHQLASSKAKGPALPDVAEDVVLATPPTDASSSPERARSRRPLYRKNSMDNLVPEDSTLTGGLTKENANIIRASTRLQARADRFFTFHPYANARPKQSASLSAAPCISVSGASSEPLLPAQPQLRRVASSASTQLATVNESGPSGLSSVTPTFATPARVPLHRTSNPCLVGQRVGRPDSSVRPSSMGATVFAEEVFTESGVGKAMGASGGADSVTTGTLLKQTLKRAPSFGVAAQQKKSEEEKKIKAKQASTVTQGKQQVSERKVTRVSETRAPVQAKSPIASTLTAKRGQCSKTPSPPPKARMHGVSPSPTSTVTSVVTATSHSPSNTNTTSHARSLSPGIYSSDEEEKKRAKTIKRFKSTRKPSFLGDELSFSMYANSERSKARDRCDSAEGQTISVEEYTLSSMASMESLGSMVPSLSGSSSISALSLRSVETIGTGRSIGRVTDQSKEKRPRKVPAPVIATPRPINKGKERYVIPPVPTHPQLPVNTSPASLAQPPSPPRTLRRVGKKSLKLGPHLPSAPIQTPSPARSHTLSDISRTLSFGGSPDNPKNMAGLLGAAFGLESPFEEKKPTGNKGYLF